MDVCTQRLISTAKAQLCISFLNSTFHHVFLWTVNLFKRAHKQTKRTSGCSRHTIVTRWMHLGSDGMLLVSWSFLGGIPTTDSSTKHSFDYLPKSNTTCDTKDSVTSGLCSAFALLSTWLQIPPKTLYHYPLRLYTMHLRAGTTHSKHRLLIDDICWYFHHSLKTLTQLFLPRASLNMCKVAQRIYSFTRCMFSSCTSLQRACLPAIHFHTHLLLSGSGALQILI